jgi:biotin transport system substrate-specific component
MALGSIIIYAFGAAWLAHRLNVPVATGDTNALSLGVTPFLIGDAIKLVLAGTLLPGAWALANRKSS